MKQVNSNVADIMPAANKRTLGKRIGMNIPIYILLLPILLYFLIFRYIPMFGNIIAFQDYSITRGILNSRFVGLKNFTDFLSSYKFWTLMRNTLSISLLEILFGFPSPIIFALLLNEVKHLRFKKSVQTITYMPHFISTVVICSLLLDFVSSEGLINGIRALFGGQPIAFMSDPKYFYTIYVSSQIWQSLGWSSIIYIANIASIDQELYEAAVIDGAGRWKQAIHITLPSLSETIVILLIMRMGSLVSVGYHKIILMYNSAIYETADVISTFVYRRGLLEADYSYSAAVGLFNSIINFVMLMSTNYISKKVKGSGLW